MAELNCPLREASDISPHEIALVSGEAQFLYSDFDQMVSLVARRLKDRGFRAGDRIGIFRPLDEYLVALILACLRLGVVACPLNTRWPRPMVAEALKRIRAAAVIARGATGDVDGVPRIEPDPLFAAGGEPLAWSGRMEIDRPATIIFTSGSAGLPKAALHSYGNHYYNARGANANLRIHTRDRWLLSLPLYHVGGLGILFRCLLGGATTVIPQEGHELTALLIEHKVTHVSLVATQLQRLLAAPEFATAAATLKAVVVGGGPTPGALVREARKRGLAVYMSYGMTEMASQIATVRPDTPPARQETSGTLLRHRELKISDAGEILVRGSTLFLGYVEGDTFDPHRDAEGWFATGDLGSLSADGYLSVSGRRDNQFISGGENIQPEEIERALCGMPGVDAALVVPVPDAEFGLRPAAFIAGDAKLEDLEQPLRERLPGYLIPVAFLPWETAEAGKPDRRERAARACALLDR